MKKWLWVLLVIVVILVVVLLVINPRELAGKIKVGVVMPLSGTSAFFGEQFKKGMEMCNPGNLEYFYEDSLGAAATGVTAYNKATQIDKVDVTIVGMSTVIPAILPIAKQNKDFVIATFVTAADIGKIGGESVFRYYVNGYGGGQTIAESMVKRGVKNVGIIYVQNEYGEAYKNGAADLLKNKNISVSLESILATEVDPSTSLLKLKQKGVDSILVVAYDKQTLQIVSKIKELKFAGDVYGAWMWGDKDLNTNSQALEGIIIPRSLYLFGSNEKAVKFNNMMKEKFNSEGNQWVAIGCDLSMLIGENNVDTFEKMKKLKSFNGINGEIKQAEYGEFAFPVKMVQYKGGVVSALE